MLLAEPTLFYTYIKKARRSPLLLNLDYPMLITLNLDLPVGAGGITKKKPEDSGFDT